MAISLNDALSLLQDPLKPGSIEFVSYDENRKTGGEVIRLPSVVQVGASHNKKQNDTIVVKPVDRTAHPYPVHIHFILKVNNNEIFI